MGGLLALVAFAWVAGTGWVWFRRAMAVRLPADRTGFVVAMTAGAALGAGALVLGTGWLGGLLAGAALLGGGFFDLLVAISAQKGGPGAFRVGAPVPELVAPDEHGEPFRLSSLAGRPLLLKVFRGHW